jgi:hypothetical protein
MSKEKRNPTEKQQKSQTGGEKQIRSQGYRSLKSIHARGITQYWVFMLVIFRAAFLRSHNTDAPVMTQEEQGALVFIHSYLS